MKNRPRLGEPGQCRSAAWGGFGKGKDGYFLVPLRLALFLLDDLVDQLRGRGIKPNLAALGADLGRNVLKAVELLAPGLGVGDGLFLEGTAALGTFVFARHNHSFLRVHGSTQISGSYQWTVMMWVNLPSKAQAT